MRQRARAEDFVARLVRDANGELERGIEQTALHEIVARQKANGGDLGQVDGDGALEGAGGADPARAPLGAQLQQQRRRLQQRVVGRVGGYRQREARVQVPANDVAGLHGQRRRAAVGRRAAPRAPLHVEQLVDGRDAIQLVDGHGHREHARRRASEAHRDCGSACATRAAAPPRRRARAPAASWRRARAGAPGRPPRTR
ncbi:hypothetical protein FGB62_61g154 [Gracilaria domingensis]|nr:hypothetical protein FGB62_61g154 [Gracilaria domingensis]